MSQRFALFATFSKIHSMIGVLIRKLPLLFLLAFVAANAEEWNYVGWNRKTTSVHVWIEFKAL